MDIRKLQRVIVDGLEDVKAQNIVVFNTEHLSALFERVIIASGTSNRQTKSLAGSVRDAVKTAGYPVPRTEGESNGEWIIVDCGAAVVHVMQPTIRDYYHLEEIWGDKPVNMKLATGGAKLVKAAEPDAPVRKAAAKKAAAKKAAPRAPAKAPPRKPVAAKTTAAKVVAKKAPARKAPPGKVVTRVVGVKSSAAKREPAKAAPAKRPAAKKAPARKTTSRA
ncbi:MAG TPA: ribosome silencing factor [Burkholderiaceae bacterium]|nr:ribosome silencing factor [Burkholderiaceae bacterium]